MTKLGRMEKRVMLSDRHAKDNIAHLERVLPHVRMEGKRDFLELGCGGGQVSRYLLENYGMNVTGTDVDPDMVEHAVSRSESLEGATFRTADATALPFEDSSFDLALSFGVLHHICNWPDVIEEVSRVLRPGGEYILGDIAYSRVSRALLGPFVKNYGVYTIDELLAKAAEAGLRVQHREPFSHGFLKYHAVVLRKDEG